MGWNRLFARTTLILYVIIWLYNLEEFVCRFYEYIHMSDSFAS